MLCSYDQNTTCNESVHVYVTCIRSTKPSEKAQIGFFYPLIILFNYFSLIMLRITVGAFASYGNSFYT